MGKSPLDIAWVLVCTGLIFVMQAGFLCLESGFTRTKNSINVAIKNLTDFGVSVVLFWLCGYALMFGTSRDGWIGQTGWLFRIGEGDPWLDAFFLFQVMFCATSTTILSGAVAERVGFLGYLIIATVVSGLLYPVFGHWAWNGAQAGSYAGWLAQAGFVDFAGSSVVHSVGGWVSLAVLLIIGPREGRFPPGGKPRNFTGSNIPLSVLGVCLLWLGWFGFNGGSTLAVNRQIAGVLANTVLAGAAGMVITLGVGWVRLGRPDVRLVINGSLAGLVAITASCHAVSSASAVAIGGIAGLVMLGVEHLLEHYRIDDAVGAVPVHLGAGIWGTLAVALFGEPAALGTGLDRVSQAGIQGLGIVACGVWSLGIGYLVLRSINRFFRFRVTPEQERIGLNVSEHGATTELLDLATAMDAQARTGDLSLRAPVEPFTEVGQIAEQYNRVMQALEETREYTGHIVSTTTTLISRIAPDGTILSVNPAVTRTTGYSAQEMIGRNWWRIFYPGEDFRQVERLRRDFSNTPLINYEMALTTKAGVKRVISWNIVNRFGPSGEFLEVISIGADVTERREVERMKDEFLSLISHELRTPLTSIRMSLTMLAEGTLGPLLDKGQRMVQIAVASTDRLVRLINDLLDIERLQSGRLQMTIQPCDVRALLQQAAEAMQAMAQTAGVTLSVAPVRASVPADSFRILQVLNNLLNNAIKFSPAGSTVWLSAAQEGDRVLIQVKDQGRGIPPDKLESIFERFQQVDASDAREKGGAGLGLPICRGIVEQHGGRIWAASTLGESSTFFVALPAGISQAVETLDGGALQQAPEPLT